VPHYCATEKLLQCKEQLAAKDRQLKQFQEDFIERDADLITKAHLLKTLRYDQQEVQWRLLRRGHPHATHLCLLLARSVGRRWPIWKRRMLEHSTSERYFTLFTLSCTSLHFVGDQKHLAACEKNAVMTKRISKLETLVVSLRDEERVLREVRTAAYSFLRSCLLTLVCLNRS
jgi:hypothetical protein